MAEREGAVKNGSTVQAGDFIFENYIEKKRYLGLWGSTWKEDKEKYEEKALDLMAKHYEFYGKVNQENQYVTKGSILYCSAGTHLSRFDMIKDHGVVDGGEIPIGICSDCKLGDNIYSFGGCSSTLREGDHRRTLVTAWDGTQRCIRQKCIPMLNGSWNKTGKARVKIWDHEAEEYCDAITTGDYLVCYYGGIIRVAEVNRNVQNLTNTPLNDYKTISNFNLIGTSASKNYITLTQLKRFKFEYNRQTYINKLAGYTAKDFQGIVSNPTEYLNEIKIQLDYLNNEFSNISDQDIVSNFNYHIEKYGIGKYDEAVLMFMAITAQESLYGKRMVELWDSSLGYSYNQRGGGYSQLTGISPGNSIGNQVGFLSSVGYSSNAISNILDQPFHIGTYLPMSSACYAWTTGNAIACDLTTDIIEYGMKQGADMRLIYLAICYAINGYKYGKSGLKTLLKEKTFSEPSSAPNGWMDRKRSYNEAIQIFSHGSSSFGSFIV